MEKAKIGKLPSERAIFYWWADLTLMYVCNRSMLYSADGDEENCLCRENSYIPSRAKWAYCYGTYRDLGSQGSPLLLSCYQKICRIYGKCQLFYCILLHFIVFYFIVFYSTWEKERDWSISITNTTHFVLSHKRFLFLFSQKTFSINIK